ncbi:MAG: hypothetical protein ABI867_33020 [Kofleriaceae bacterium]
MKRTLALVLLVAACTKSKGPPLAPLPPDNPPVAAAPADAAKPDPAAEKPARPVPTGPLEVKVPAAKTTVKLVNAGKGKRAPLKLTAKVGNKQQVEIALDFALTQSAGGQSQSDIVPTVVLAGDAEAKSVDKDGAAAYTLTINKTDARAVAGTAVPLDKFKEILASTNGLVFDGSVGANGATGDITMKLAKQGEASAQVLELVRLTLPSWPALPTEPVGVGAKWQATTLTKLADRLDVTQVVDYELVAFANNTWTIKGTTKITGADQMMQGGKITKIAGKGTTEATLVDGKLYPNHKTAVEATFTASEPDAKPGTPAATLDFNVKIAGAVTAN